MTWTVSQRRAALVMLVLLVIGLSILMWQRQIFLSDPLTESIHRDEIADRLDPNNADAEALSAIPNLGEKRAAEIVAYRTAFLIQYPGKTAFTQPDDLMRIKGIGAGTVANMRPYLTFSAPGNVRR